MIRVTVLYFAKAREVAGLSEDIYEITDGVLSSSMFSSANSIISNIHNMH